MDMRIILGLINNVYNIYRLSIDHKWSRKQMVIMIMVEIITLAIKDIKEFPKVMKMKMFIEELMDESVKNESLMQVTEERVKGEKDYFITRLTEIGFFDQMDKNKLRSDLFKNINKN